MMQIKKGLFLIFFCMMVINIRNISFGTSAECECPKESKPQIFITSVYNNTVYGENMTLEWKYYNTTEVSTACIIHFSLFTSSTSGIMQHYYDFSNTTIADLPKTGFLQLSPIFQLIGFQPGAELVFAFTIEYKFFNNTAYFQETYHKNVTYIYGGLTAPPYIPPSTTAPLIPDYVWIILILAAAGIFLLASLLKIKRQKDEAKNILEMQRLNYQQSVITNPQMKKTLMAELDDACKGEKMFKDKTCRDNYYIIYGKQPEQIPIRKDISQLD